MDVDVTPTDAPSVAPVEKKKKKKKHDAELVADVEVGVDAPPPTHDEKREKKRERKERKERSSKKSDKSSA
jgi:cell growth-regulating nucleolar protein